MSKPKKDMKMRSDSPLGQLMHGGTIRDPGKLGKEEDHIPFVELLEEGWTVKSPAHPLSKHFGGIMREEMLMLVPTDESMQSQITRIHEMLHVAVTPKKGLKEMSDRDQVPTEVINAFEDGRINAIGHREVDRFRKLINRRALPVDTEALAHAVADTIDRRADWQSKRDFDHPHYFAYLEDEEIRMTGACMMAASEAYSHKHHEEWLDIGRACLMDEDQLSKVAALCHGLGEMSYEQMIESMKDLAEFLMNPPAEPEEQPDGESSKGDREGFDDDTKTVEAEGDDESDDDADDQEDGDGEADDGEPDEEGEIEGPDGRLRSGMGEGEGRDYTPEQAGSDLTFQIKPDAEVEKLPLPPIKPQPKDRLQRVGQRVATFDANKTKVSNKHAFSDRFQPMVAGDRSKSPAYAGEKIAYQAKIDEHKRKFDAQHVPSNITDRDYGVTEAEEAAVAGRYEDRAYYDPKQEYVKPPMAILEYELTEQVIAPMGNERKARKHDRVGYMTSPSRAHIDGKVFRRKMRVRRLEPAGAILLDCSGSMHPSSELIRQSLEIAPYAIVGGYGGNDAGSGNFAILAQNRRCVSQAQLSGILRDLGGGNSVDFPALEWLASQPGPRVWVSDAGICGSGSNEAVNAHLCFQLCRQYEIRRVLTLEMLVGLKPLSNNMQGYVNAAARLAAAEAEGGS